MENVKIALLGCGTVGTGVWNILNSNTKEIKHRTGVDVDIAKVLVRDKFKRRSIPLPDQVITTDFNDILSDDDIQIVVEVMGGTEPAQEYIEKSIARGKHVVTANKLLLSKHGCSLYEKARERGVTLNYEASVCGGIPIIGAIRESLTANRIEEVAGIVNGTTNYILSRMSETGCSFEDALLEAQQKGYAEADPTSDVEGFDALYKLRIISNLAYGVDIDESLIHREGITRITREDISYSKELGYEIKLMAVSKRIENSVDMRVHPALIPFSNPLAKVSDSFNGVCVKGNAVGELFFTGRGAGELPTGSAVVGDILHIIRNRPSNGLGIADTSASPLKSIDIKQIEFCYYLRLKICAQQDTVKNILQAFEQNSVPIAFFSKKRRCNDGFTVVLTTHRVKEYNLQNLVCSLKSLSVVKELGSLIRIL